jgi:hypothetical protein
MWQNGLGLSQDKVGQSHATHGVHSPLKRSGESVRIFLFSLLCGLSLNVASPAFAKAKHYSAQSAAKFVRDTGECPLLIPSWRKGSVSKLKTPKVKYIYRVPPPSSGGPNRVKGFLGKYVGLKVGSQVFWESWELENQGGMYRGVFEYCDRRFSRKKPQSVDARLKTISKFKGQKSAYKSTGPLEHAYLKTIRPTPVEKAAGVLGGVGASTALLSPLLLLPDMPDGVTGNTFIATAGGGLVALGVGLMTAHLGWKKRHKNSPLAGKVRKMYANVKAMEKKDKSMGKRCVSDAGSEFSSKSEFLVAKSGCDSATGSIGGSGRPKGSYSWRSGGDSKSLRKALKRMKYYASILVADEACKRADRNSKSSCDDLSEFWKNNRGQAKKFRLMTGSQISSTLQQVAQKEAARSQREAARTRRAKEDEEMQRWLQGMSSGASSGTGTSRSRQCATPTSADPMDPVPSGYYRRYTEHRKVKKWQMGKDLKSHCPSSYRCTDSEGNCEDVPLHHYGVEHSFVECFYVHNHLNRSR